MSKKIDNNVTTLAAKMAEGISWSDGAAKLSLETYYKHAPQGVTPEVVKAVDEYSLHYQQAALLALGHAAQDHLRANADLSQIPVTAEWGMGSTTGIVQRQQTFTPPNGGETVTTHGGMSRIAVNIDSYGTPGAFKSIKDHLKERGLEILGC